MIFLISYDRHLGVLKALRAFRDDERTEAESLRLSLELTDAVADENLEVVLLEAQSEEDLHKTHRRYFATASELAKTSADNATTASLKSN